MWRVLIQWMTSLWLLWMAVFGGFILLSRDHIAEIMRVESVGAHYLIDFQTGLMISTQALPPPLAAAMSPDGQFFVSVIGSPRGSWYRLLHIATQTSEMVGPYRAPLGARTPVFWSDDNHLWLVTLSRDGTQTILRGIDPHAPQAVSEPYTYDFAAYYVRLAPNQQWLVLGTEAFRTTDIAHSVYEVAAANIETGALVRLGMADSLRVGWSNNGEWVVTQVRDDALVDNPIIIHWQHILSGRSFTARAAAFEREVVWSKNGMFAAYRLQAANGDYQLYLLNLDTLQTRLIMSGEIPGNMYWVGDVLLVEVFTYPERTIYRMDGDRLRELASLPQASLLPLIFAPDEQYLIYRLRENREHAIYRLHLSTGRHERFTGFETMPISIEWER